MNALVEPGTRGHQCTENVVARMLHEVGYSLRGNAKTVEGRRHPGRDAQFGYINDQVKAALAGEHRLFSAFTMNWRGTPLTSHEAVVSLIGATRTATGLTVNAVLDTGSYP